MNPRLRITLEYVLAAIIVIVLGGLAGWYFFLRSATSDTTSKDIARGYTTTSSFEAGASPDTATSTIAESAGAAERPPQLWHLTVAPVGGASFVGTSTGMRIRFVERASGNVFDADPSSGSVTRVSNKLLPKIYDASFAHTGALFLRSLDENGVETTFSGKIAATASTTETLSGSYIAGGIKDASIDPSSGAVTYLVPTGNGYGIFRLDRSGKAKQLMASAIGDWRLEPAGSKTIIFTAPADGLSGTAYELKDSGALTTIIGNIPGLTIAAHPSSQAILFGSSDQGLLLFARLSASSTSSRLSLRTVAEKCVWLPGRGLVAYCAAPQTTPSGNFLDLWYKGVLHTSDQWWIVDASAGTSEVVYTPGTNLSLDVKDPIVDGSGNYIAFKDAHDDSLWVFRIEP